MKRTFFLLSLCVLVSCLFASGFSCSSEKQKDKPEFVEDTKPTNQVSAGYDETVIVELTIFPANYLILDEANPVEVSPTADEFFVFKTKNYRINPATRVFPMQVELTVSDRAQLGPHTLKLAMRIYYRNKADNEPQIRNAILDVPVVITEHGQSGPAPHRFPVEYNLE
jgi:hypothetical protein